MESRVAARERILDTDREQNPLTLVDDSGANGEQTA